MLTSYYPKTSTIASASKPIYVELNGGLGNQLFQYAYARTIADSRSCKLILCISELKRKRIGVTPRHYSLDAFDVRAEIYSGLSIHNQYKLEVLRRAPSIGLALGIRIEKGKIFQLDAANDQSSTYFKGFWQSPRYFSSNADRIFSDFIPKKRLSISAQKFIEQINPKKSVMLHVRRGDYVTSSSASAYHSTVSIDYYRAAIEICRSRIYEPQIYVFSDDIDWCRNALSFIDLPVVYVQPDSRRADWEDLVMMSNCGNHIIANSSFSWWSAWIADRRFRDVNRIVCTPSKWFVEHPISPADRFPESWISI